MPACLRCGSELKSTYKFCMSCGYPVQRATGGNSYRTTSGDTTDTQTKEKEVHIPVCIRCGANMEPSYSFCMSCGYPSLRKKQSNPQTDGNQKDYSSSQANTKTSYPVCKKCGERIDLSDMFCMSCGYQVHPQKRTTASEKVSSYSGAQPVSEKDKCIAELNKICEYFGRVQSLYNEYDECYKLRSEISQKLREERNNDFNLDGIAIFIALVGSVLVLAGQLVWALFSFKDAFWWLLAGNCLAPGGVLLLIFSFKQHGKIRRELQKRDSQQASLATELTKHYANYGYCIVGPEYTNPKILYRIRENLCSGKAETLDKAIKKLYHDVHKREYRAKINLGAELENNNAQGANNASAFIPADFFEL